MMRIGIATVFTPGINGGAEALADGLAGAVRDAGHSVQRIEMPFVYDGLDALERSIAAWRSQDFSRFGGGAIDRMICLKFPSYLLAHPRKSVWLLHQHRPAYDLAEEPDGLHEKGDAGRRLSAAIRQADRAALGAAERLFTIGRPVSRRLAESTGLAAEAVHHPPPDAAHFFTRKSEPFILVPSRLESLKRQSLFLDALTASDTAVGAIIVGEGGMRGALESRVASLGLQHRVRFAGALPREALIALYARCLAVFFAPQDEDYGYVTVEAMLAAKPVITCSDSGGPTAFVVDGETGFVTAPDPAALAAALSRLCNNPDEAKALGIAGRKRYDALAIGWEPIVSALLKDDAPC